MNRIKNTQLAHATRAMIVVILSVFLLALGPRGSVELRDPLSPVEVLTASDDPFDRIALEATLRGLARQAAECGCIDFGAAAFCLHPDTSPEDAERILQQLPTYVPGAGLVLYNRLSRWTYTATDGATGSIGDPITITWGFVPDGTWADGGASDLFAKFDAEWGSSGWMTKMRAAFQRWEDETGITYVEVSDDGASMPSASGQIGVRGDVRIGGRSIDGTFNVLAYNYYPNTGDMILDTDDAPYFHNPVNNYANLKNVTAHEHGHGIGLGHVIPTDCTKLMEAYQCGATAFVGPQDDDIRGGMRNYGDPYENNDSNTEPTDLGTIIDTVVVENLSIDNGTSDTDWYLVSLTATAVTIQVDPIGSTYQVGPDGGTASWVSTDSISDLDIDLYDAAGTVLLTSATSAGVGETEVLSYIVPSDGDYQIQVYRKAGTGNNVQRYTMTIYSDPFAGIHLADEDAWPRSGLALSVYPNPFDSRATVRFFAPSAGPYRMDVFDVSGRLARAIDGRALNPGWQDVIWDGRSDGGTPAAAGIYFLRVSSGDRAETKRVFLAR